MGMTGMGSLACKKGQGNDGEYKKELGVENLFYICFVYTPDQISHKNSMTRSIFLFVFIFLASEVFCQNNTTGLNATAKGMNLPPVSAYLDEKDDTITSVQFQKIIKQGYYEMQIIQKQNGMVDLRLTPKPFLTLLNNPLPDFEFTDINGKHWNNRTINGHMTILHFWSMKNKACLKEFGWMNALKRANPEIFWLAPAIESTEKLEQFIENHKFDLTIIPGQKDFMGELFVEGLPFDIIIDKNGIIREVVAGNDPERIETFIDNNFRVK
jgi:hypothetical protein